MAVKQISLEREYEKNPNIKEGDIRILREWIKTQPHLPGDFLSDVDLLIAYQCSDTSVEVTKQLLDLHFSVRTLFENIFKDRTIDRNIKSILDTVLYFPFPTTTVEGYLAVYIRLINVDPKKFLFVGAVSLFMLIFDLLQYEHGTWPGALIILDMEGTTLSHLGRIDITTLRNLLYFVQECMFVKLREIIFLNAPAFMDKLMLMMRPFLNKSMLDIIKIHPKGSESIYEKVPKKSFPTDFGGEYKDVKTITSEMWQKLKANEDFYKHENKRRVNEKLRPGNPTTVENLFGIQGSFKKLDID